MHSLKLQQSLVLNSLKTVTKFDICKRTYTNQTPACITYAVLYAHTHTHIRAVIGISKNNRPHLC